MHKRVGALSVRKFCTEWTDVNPTLGRRVLVAT